MVLIHLTLALIFLHSRLMCFFVVHVSVVPTELFHDILSFIGDGVFIAKTMRMVSNWFNYAIATAPAYHRVVALESKLATKPERRECFGFPAVLDPELTALNPTSQVEFDAMLLRVGFPFPDNSPHPVDKLQLVRKCRVASNVITNVVAKSFFSFFDTDVSHPPPRSTNVRRMVAIHPQLKQFHYYSQSHQALSPVVLVIPRASTPFFPDNTQLESLTLRALHSPDLFVDEALRDGLFFHRLTHLTLSAFMFTSSSLTFGVAIRSRMPELTHLTIVDQLTYAIDSIFMTDIARFVWSVKHVRLQSTNRFVAELLEGGCLYAKPHTTTHLMLVDFVAKRASINNEAQYQQPLVPFFIKVLAIHRTVATDIRDLVIPLLRLLRLHSKTHTVHISSEAPLDAVSLCNLFAVFHSVRSLSFQEGLASHPFVAPSPIELLQPFSVARQMNERAFRQRQQDESLLVMQRNMGHPYVANRRANPLPIFYFEKRELDFNQRGANQVMEMEMQPISEEDLAFCIRSPMHDTLENFKTDSVLDFHQTYGWPSDADKNVLRA
jgi:hypothetical protein